MFDVGDDELTSRMVSSKEWGSDEDIQEVQGQKERIITKNKAKKLQMEMEGEVVILLNLKFVRDPDENRLFQILFVSNYES